MGIRLRTIEKYLMITLTVSLALAIVLSINVKAQTDSDNDGMPDTWEEEHDLDPKNSTDADEDNDGDGLTNAEEYNNGTNSTDPNNPDSDNGGVNDSTERNHGNDPLSPADDKSVDSDGDGMPDVWEQTYGLDPSDPEDANEDLDKDNYTNLQEYLNNSDPKDIKDPEKSKPSDKIDDDAEGEAAGLTSTPVCLIILIPGVIILIVIIFVYTKMRRDRLLEHDKRNKIYEYINHNPGTHYRALMNDLGLHMGTLTHHLNMLETQRYIKSYQDGMYRRFYPIDAKIDTGLILTDVQKRILHMVQDNPGISQTGIAKKMGITRKIVHYHIKLLADAGFVHVETVGRETNLHYLGGLDLEAASVSSQVGKAG